MVRFSQAYHIPKTRLGGKRRSCPKKVEALNPEAKAFLETRTVNYVPEQSW